MNLLMSGLWEALCDLAVFRWLAGSMAGVQMLELWLTDLNAVVDLILSVIRARSSLAWKSRDKHWGSTAHASAIKSGTNDFCSKLETQVIINMNTLNQENETESEYSQIGTGQVKVDIVKKWRQE